MADVAVSESGEFSLPTEVTDLKVSRSYATEEVHFSGGLRGQLTNRGWALFPVSGNPEADALVFRTIDAHRSFITECGLELVGVCVHYHREGNYPPMDVWEPGSRDPKNGLNAADSWIAISRHALEESDKEYADRATSIGICAKVAGLRLRDLSTEYHRQLTWALSAGKSIGTWFSNIAMFELYADCHSLVAELCAARDHLARIAAIHAEAPSKIDSLARLSEWVGKQRNQSCANQPLIAQLLTANGTEDQPGWLSRLSALRNEMLHRLPMGADKRVSGLALEQMSTSQGMITTIRLAEPTHEKPLKAQGADPLVELSQLSKRFESLLRSAWPHARYPATLQEFVSRAAT